MLAYNHRHPIALVRVIIILYYNHLRFITGAFLTPCFQISNNQHHDFVFLT